MHLLNSLELTKVSGGSSSSILDKLYLCYRIIKIRILMEKVFID